MSQKSFKGSAETDLPTFSYSTTQCVGSFLRFLTGEPALIQNTVRGCVSVGQNYKI